MWTSSTTSSSPGPSTTSSLRSPHSCRGRRATTRRRRSGRDRRQRLGQLQGQSEMGLKSIPAAERSTTSLLASRLVSRSSSRSRIKLKVIEKTTCNNSWNTPACYDGLLRGENASSRLLTTTVSDVMKYGVTPAVNFSVNVSDEGGVSPALEYFEFVSCTLSLAAVFMSAWGGFLNSQQINKINVFLRKAGRFGLCSPAYLCDVSEYLRLVDSKLFNRIQSPSHCLSHLLPPEKHHLGLRPRGHSYTLHVHCVSKKHPQRF